ncbi:MAG: hypothetical protein ACLP50_17525 [Solirubrobacteraceae bacterium]
MSEESNSPDQRPAESTNDPQGVYRRLQERNARRQRLHQQKLERLAERSAHHGPHPFRHPSR